MVCERSSEASRQSQTTASLLTICYATPADGVRPEPTFTIEIRTAEYESAPTTTSPERPCQDSQSVGCHGEEPDAALGLLQDFSGTQVEDITVHDRQNRWPTVIADVTVNHGLPLENVGFVDRDALAAVGVTGVAGVTTG